MVPIRVQLDHNAVLLHQLQSLHRVVLYVVVIIDLVLDIVHLVSYFTNTYQHVFHQEV